jgi:Uma2 family endonuclease
MVKSLPWSAFGRATAQQPLILLLPCVESLKAHLAECSLKRSRPESSPECFFYPDVVVTCDPRDRLTPQFISHPSLIIEILSESTAAFDRGEKFAHYRQLESLQEFGIVDLKAKRIEIFRRNAENHWVLYEYRPGEEFELPSLNARISVDEIFDDTDEPSESPENV